jgi:hypothetical protein
MRNHLIQFLVFILLLILMQSCGGKNNGGSTNPNQGKETSNSEMSYTSKEKAFADKLSHCFEDYERNQNEFGNFEDNDAQFVAIGVTGNECLDIKNTSALKFIQMEYKNAKNGSNKNWNLMARKILKKGLI